MNTADVEENVWTIWYGLFLPLLFTQAHHSRRWRCPLPAGNAKEGVRGNGCLERVGGTEMHELHCAKEWELHMRLFVLLISVLQVSVCIHNSGERAESCMQGQTHQHTHTHTHALTRTANTNALKCLLACSCIVSSANVPEIWLQVWVEKEV